MDCALSKSQSWVRNSMSFLSASVINEPLSFVPFISQGAVNREYQWKYSRKCKKNPSK